MVRYHWATSIASKLLAAFVLSGLATIGLTAWVSFRTSQAALERASFERLTAVRATKQRQIETTFSTMRDQVRAMAESSLAREALSALGKAFHEAHPSAANGPSLRAYYEDHYLTRLNANLEQPAALETVWPADPLTRHWQERYIAGNEYPVGAKDNLVRTGDGSSYDQAHAGFHPLFRRFIERFGYYDLFLVDARTGHIVYTVFKETDYATSLLDGPYRDTNLARLFGAALRSSAAEFCELIDYQGYPPSYAAPAAFIAAPIYDGQEKIGVLAVQLPVDEINRVMTGDRQWQREGLGATGETYLVGDDFRMRSDSRFLIEDPDGFFGALVEFKRPSSEIEAIRRLKTTILQLEVRSGAAQDALLGNTGTRIIHDYRNIPVLSSWVPLDIPGLRWVLLSEIDEAEAFAPIAMLKQRVLWASGLLALPVLLLGLGVAAGFARPARRLLRGIQLLHKGDLTQRVNVRSRDELGELAGAFNAMAEELEHTTVSKDYVDSVFQSMNDALIVAEPGEDELKIADANPCALRTLNRSLSELQGQPLSRVVVPAGGAADGAWSAANVDLLVASSQQRPLEGQVLPLERAAIPVLLSLSALRDDAGALKRLVVVAHDITEQKNAQDALTRANTLKDAFLANTSHELRTPLNGIIGMGEALMEGVAGPINGAQRRNLSMIVSSGRRLANLINDILDFSKLRHRTLDLQRKPVDPYALVEMVLALTRPLIARKAVEVLNRIDPSTPLIHGDENRLQQIVYNLIGNGIKFTAEGRVEIAAETRGGFLAISVVDTGIGIAADKLESIFESFEQGDGSTAREYGGTGLGLAITRQLVELHGGTLTVSSEVDRGSRFTFTVPLSDAARGEETASTGAPEERLAGIRIETSDEAPTPVVDGNSSAAYQKEARILIVDDEPVNLQVLQNYLSLEHYAVVHASSGIEALEIVQTAGPFDLVILDIMMPRMSGYECCRKLREAHSANELPVLLLTAKNQVGDLVAGFDAGANDYLTKPFSRHELLSRVRTHVNLARIHSAADRFVPREFLRFLHKDSLVDVKPGDQVQKLMTVLFADIRGFTKLSGRMTLQEGFDFVNEYLRQMEPCIRDRRGFIDKFIGDAIMALFHTGGDDGLQAAIAMLRQLDAWNVQRAATGGEPIRIGIGLHTGSLLLGTVGGERRLESTVISDAVNLASRIESLTKAYDATLLLTEETYAVLRDPSRFAMRVIDCFTTVGSAQISALYDVFEADPPAVRAGKLASLGDFERAQALYRQRDFAGAAGLFGKIAESNPGDGTARVLAARSRRLAEVGVGAEWVAAIRIEKPEASVYGLV